jgi:hypothetical protein
MPTPSSQSEKREATKGRRPALTLLSAVLIVVGVWGFVLPRIAELPVMQEMIERLDRKGIDSGAFFYSDHPNAFK